MDSKERVIAQVTRSNYQILDHDYSGISGKHNQGGQSAARFERQRAELVKQWLKQTANIINTKVRTGSVTGDIIVAGPAQTKNKMAEYITLMKDKIIFQSGEYCNLAGIIQIQKHLNNC
jgi:peptide subunit release factor 1 (eRF1)